LQRRRCQCSALRCWLGRVGDIRLPATTAGRCASLWCCRPTPGTGFPAGLAAAERLISSDETLQVVDFPALGGTSRNGRVETYRSRLMLKLGIKSLPGLVKFALRTGMVDALSEDHQ
jgi:hypothetical protein